MSKYTHSQVRTVSLYMRTKGYDQVADMLREYAANLAAQAEWPSDEDVRTACAAHDAYGSGVVETPAMRAALQSVRPPVAVVSDEMRELYAAASKGFHTSESSGADSYYTHKSKFHTLKDLQDFSAAWTKVMLASRHAPTKD